MINWLKNTYKSELQILIRSNAGHSKKRQKAKQLQNEAKEELENAKKEVEKIILGDNYEC